MGLVRLVAANNCTDSTINPVRRQPCPPGMPGINGVICPTRAQRCRLSSLSPKNISLFRNSDLAYMLGHPASSMRGVSRSSRNARRGCGGREGAVRRAALTRTAKSRGPDAPTLASSLAQAQKACVPRRWWQTSIGSPRRARISRKPPRREGRSDVRCTCGFAPFAQLFWREGPGCSSHLVFPAPLWISRGQSRCKARADCAARTRSRVSFY